MMNFLLNQPSSSPTMKTFARLLNKKSRWSIGFRLGNKGELGRLAKNTQEQNIPTSNLFPHTHGSFDVT